MASDVHNPDKSNNDQFKNSNSSLPLVGEKIMKWRISTQDKYLVGDEQVEARGNIKRNHSSAKAAGIDPKDTKKAIDHLQAKRRKFEGSSSNRSKRMTSGSFLLPDILTTSSSLARYSVQDPILSNSRNSDERVYTNICSSKIKNVEDVSPNLKKGNAIGKNEIINSHTENSKLNQNYPKNIEFNTSKGKKIELDDESMQIINIALNLSKNRRVASSQAILRPSILNGNVENISDASLQSLTKQQRRATRKSSSKFDGPKRAFSLSSQANENATNRLPSIILNSHSEQAFKYNFSPSTLARSKKAKIYFELMAQYRRLLNFVPPLRTCSDRSEKAKNSISALLDNHENLESSSSQIRTRHTNHLGRDYNPLQYIRNRRLRARISKTINGEAEGFGDVENVSVWIDSVAKYVSSGEYQDRINFSLPKFPLQTYEKSGSNFPVRDNSDKHQESSTKVKRPRIDWIVNPCDLIADLYWVEQGENKKLIEDRFGNTIFDEEIESRKPIIHDNKKKDKDKDKKISPEINQQGSRLDLSIETEMPVIKSSKPELHEAAYDSTHKSIQGFHNFKNAVYIDHSPNRREKHQAKSQIRSGSSSQSLSSSKGSGHRKYRHSAKHKKVYPVLSSEKQVNKLTFKKDSRVDDSFYEAGLGRDSYESQMLYMNSHPEYQNQKIPNSLVDLSKEDSQNNHVYNFNNPTHRFSGEYRESTSESTLPSSSWGRTKKFKGSRINIIKPAFPKAHNLNARRSDEREDLESKRQSDSRTRMNLNTSLRRPKKDLLIPEKISNKVVLEREKAEKNLENLKRARPESERLSGIRGLLRNARNPISRLTDYLWRKDVNSYPTSFSTDDFDLEDLDTHRPKVEELSTSLNVTHNQSLRENANGLMNKKSSSLFNQETFPITSHDNFIFENQPELATIHKTPKREFNESTRQDKLQIEFNNNSSKLSLDQRRFSDSASSNSSVNLESCYSTTTNANSGLNVVVGATNISRKLHPTGNLSSLGYSNQRNQDAWQNYESKIKLNHNFMLGKEIARVRTLLISSGIKAKEIKRRAEIKKDLTADENSSYVDVAALTQRPLARVSKIQKHKLAVQIISEDINRSLYVWNTTSEMLIRKTIKSLKHRIISLRTEITENLTPLTRLAADEADSLSQNLITDHRLAVTQIADQITQLKRRRKARFRWLGRGWWIMLEWVLIGIMWWVWFIVVITRIVLGTAKIVIGAIKWLVWL
ncbi:hypothetical protein EV44_g5765 [Erysiphe necator]|uniref:Uncharacterized protein n=1 Tax=Uncinula necator TaxID=52586 RepID=A0A0B1P0J2_UNCNE|nr:hypothetical protein EV44_g5765 [Erysiphe necator]